MKKRIPSALGIVFLLLMLVFSHCDHDGRQGDRIQEDTFIEIYSETLIAQTITQGDTLRFRARVDSLYRSAGVTKAQFDSTMNWYNRDAARLHTMYAKMLERLEKKKSNR